MKKLVTALFAMLFVSPVLAQSIFQVASQVFHHGELVASPVMLVEANKEASMSMGDDFYYQLTVSPNDDNTVSIVTRVTVAGETFEPSLIVAYDREAIIEIGAQKLSMVISKASH